MILNPSSTLTLHRTQCFSEFLCIPAHRLSSSPFDQFVSRGFSTREMSCSCVAAPPTLRTVSISFSDLKDKNVDLSPKIEEGFGPHGLGILSISDV
ncbi:hypothetical protein U1Q18_028540 [Sarracenia purpurea var. burkii]